MALPRAFQAALSPVLESAECQRKDAPAIAAPSKAISAGAELAGHVPRRSAGDLQRMALGHSSCNSWGRRAPRGNICACATYSGRQRRSPSGPRENGAQLNASNDAVTVDALSAPTAQRNLSLNRAMIAAPERPRPSNASS